jgi:hypothetical protein
MEKFTLLFSEYVLKAITMTENFLACDFSKEINFEDFTNNRERLFQVMDQISQQIDWNSVAEETRNEFNRQIEYIKKLDDQLIVKLQQYSDEVKKDIERTVRSKDNVKGYNLNDVK